jgi:hypothetical protein
MPSNVVKSYAKKSGKDTSTVEKDWDDSKGAAKKAGLSPDSDRYWAYVNATTKAKSGLGRTKGNTKKKESYEHNGTNWEWKNTDFPSIINKTKMLLDQLSKMNIEDNQYAEQYIHNFVRGTQMIEDFVKHVSAYQKKGM